MGNARADNPNVQRAREHERAQDRYAPPVARKDHDSHRADGEAECDNIQERGDQAGAGALSNAPQRSRADCCAQRLGAWRSDSEGDRASSCAEACEVADRGCVCKGDGAVGGGGEEGLRERVGEVRERVGALLVVEAGGEDEHV